MKPLMSLRVAHRKVCGKYLPRRMPFLRRVLRTEPAILVAVPEKSLFELFEEFSRFFNQDKSENNTIRLDSFARKRNPMYWSLLHREPFEKSNEGAFDKKLAMVPPSLIVPTVQAVVAGVITYRLRFKKFLFKDRPVMTATTIGNGLPLCVRTTSDGIIVFPQLATRSCNIGLAVARKPY